MDEFVSVCARHTSCVRERSRALIGTLRVGTNCLLRLSKETIWKETVMKLFSEHPSVRQTLFAAVMVAAAFSCLVSCSKPPPEVPMERSRVLIRLFSNLDRQENDEALKNIETYRNLDPTNMFLADFEHLVRANGVVVSAKAKLDAGDIEGALADLDAYCLKYGQDSASGADPKDKDSNDPRQVVWDAKAGVELLLEAQRLNERLLAAEFSEDLRAAATDLNVFAGKNSKLFPKLSAYAASKIKEADALALMEKNDACVALFQDALDAYADGRKAASEGRRKEAVAKVAEAATLAALLEMNADPVQRAGFEAWLLQNPANP